MPYKNINALCNPADSIQQESKIIALKPELAAPDMAAKGKGEALRAVPISAPISADDMRLWLTQNPDFLARNPQILEPAVTQFTRHHQNFDRSSTENNTTQSEHDELNNVESFSALQIRFLQKKLATHHAQNRHATRIQRDNRRVIDRTHRAILDVLDMRDLSQLVRWLQLTGPVTLMIDFMKLFVETDDPLPFIDSKPAPVLVSKGGLDSFIEKDHFCRLENIKETPRSLFGDSAPSIQSWALARLPAKLAPSWLVMGSADNLTYEPGQNLSLLRFFSTIIGRQLDLFLAQKLTIVN